MRAMFLIRLAVGAVFFCEGILKLISPDEFGAGRFAKIGIPWPQYTGPFVGFVEVVCGALIIIGLLTRLASIPLLIDIGVAIVSTKIPILLGHAYGPFAMPQAPHHGFLGMMHEARTDFTMLLGLLFLLIVGAGGWSVDAGASPGNSGT